MGILQYSNSLFNNLKAYWKLGANANDSHIYNFNGDLNGPVQTYGVIDQSYSFDGIDDYIYIDDSIVTSYPFTISAWFKTNTDPLIITDISNSTIDNLNYVLRINSEGYADCGARNGGSSFSSAISNIVVNDNKWYHIVGIFESNTIRKLYLNNEFQNENNGDVSFNTNVNGFNIGRAGDLTPSNFFSGSIDEIAIWSRVLTEDDINELYNYGSAIKYEYFRHGSKKFKLNDNSLLTDLVNYWKFDTLNNNEAIDSHSNNTGTVNGCMLCAGMISLNYYFDGVDDYVNMGNINDFGIEDSFTTSTWINIDDLSTTQMIISKRVNTSPSTGILFQYLTSSKPAIWLYNSDGVGLAVRGNKVLTNGNWYNLIISYDGTQSPTGIKIYVNGELLTNEVLINTLESNDVKNSGDFKIGINYDNSFDYAGYIDEVCVWNRVITQDEVKKIYNDGKGLKYKYFK